MQSENFDKKLKDLLSQRPPGNDKPEWEKMEVLLDKHLPLEKKDRRRIFFILFTCLLLGGGVFLIWQNNNGNRNEITSIDPKKQNTVAAENNDQPKTNTDKNISTPTFPGTNQTKTDGSAEIPKTNTSDAVPGKEIKSNPSIAKVNKNKKANNSVVKKTDPSAQTIDELVKNTEPERSLIENLTKSETGPTISEKKDPVKEPEVEKTKTENNVAEQKEGTKPVAVEKTNNNKQKNKSSFANNFFVTVSAGPDFSAVGGNTGELRMAYGAGIGYQISKKFSVRTGFYAARKVYTADPEDYHPPTNFWTYYPNLENIDANCKVYDIPVTIDYKISSRKKESWFVSAGLSSLLMKEETYEYYFKPNYSPNYITYSRTIHDQNKHYFSVLNLSGGYTRVLNKNISLQAEPYLKIALEGVGYGKVNLNSGGVLFSAVIKPFAKK
jgi:hypothetical protein